MRKGKKDKVTREDYTPEPTVNGEPIGDNFAKPGNALENATVETDEPTATGVEGETDGLNGESELKADDVEDTDEPETNSDASTEGANDDEADSGDEADEADSEESGESEADPDPNAKTEESWEYRHEIAKAKGEPIPDDTGG